MDVNALIDILICLVMQPFLGVLCSFIFVPSCTLVYEFTHAPTKKNTHTHIYIISAAISVTKLNANSQVTTSQNISFA